MGKPHAGHVLGTAACLTLPVALFAPKGLAPLLAIAAVAILAVHLSRGWTPPPVPRVATGMLAVAAALAAASALWSVTPDETLRSAPGLMGTFVAGVVLLGAARHLSGGQKRIAQGGVIWGGVLGFGLMGIDAATSGESSKALFDLVAGRLLSLDKPYRPNLSAATIGALYLWPWAMALRARLSTLVAGLGATFALAVILVPAIDAPPAALGAGAVVFGLALAAPRQAPIVLGAVITAGVLATPWLPDRLPDPLDAEAELPYLTPSAAHRLVIWKVAASHAREKPLLGHGFDASRALYGIDDKVYYTYTKSIVGYQFTTSYEPIPLHPHNGVLQVWLELGAAGALLMLGLLIWVLAAIARQVRDRGQRALCLGLLATALTIAVVSYGLWQAWWLCALFLLAGLAAAALPREPA